MKKLSIIVLSLSIVLITGCTNDKDFNKGKNQLIQQGYTDVKDEGVSWFCCDEKDMYASKFTAKDSKGNHVEGCICSGITKGVTIRFE